VHGDRHQAGMETLGQRKYWVKAASLLHTTPDGKLGSPRFTVHAQLPHLQPSARHR
jgi:hypothetical protein